VKALIGHSGFVGGTLLKRARFDDLYRSSDIGAIAGKRYDEVVCAGAPAQKWIANKDPGGDAARMKTLTDALLEVDCRRFVLISTVDVFQQPADVDEASAVVENGLHAYGLHRRQLEQFVAQRFSDHLIVRLPGLVGPGLKKNVIYDLLNDNNLNAVDARGVFQFYPTVNLVRDLAIAAAHRLKLVHLTAEPVSVREVALDGFGRAFDNQLSGAPALYDFRSRHAALFGGHGSYQYSKRETLLAVSAYAQSEPRTKP
jgi:nucleoside-diphosphate-sugar epimerase